MLLQPSSDECSLVIGDIVHNQAHFRFLGWDMTVEGFEKTEHLVLPLALVRATHDTSPASVERCE